MSTKHRDSVSGSFASDLDSLPPSHDGLPRPFDEPLTPEPVTPETPAIVRERIQAHIDAVQRARELGEAEPPSIALLIVDLDGIKDVNDSMSHEDGDVLIEAAEAEMRKATRVPDATKTAKDQELRQTDPSQKDNLRDEILHIIRDATPDNEHSDDYMLLERKHGKHGDEFVILISGVSDQDTLNKIAKRIQRALSARRVTAKRPDDSEYVIAESIEASIGGKIYEGEDIDEFYRMADIRMRHDKINRKLQSLECETEDIRRKVGDLVLWLLANPRISARRLMGFVTAKLDYYNDHPDEMPSAPQLDELAQATTDPGESRQRALDRIFMIMEEHDLSLAAVTAHVRRARKAAATAAAQ